MDWYLLCWLFPMISRSIGRDSQKYEESNLLLNKLRRSVSPYGTPMLRYPKDPEDLPEAEPMHPGHSLLRPARNSLKSSAQFPHKDSYLLYGNFDNLGITYDKTASRVKYSDFRKTSMLLDSILETAGKTNTNFKNGKSPLIVIGPFTVKRSRISKGRNMHQNMIKHDTSEIFDGSSDPGSSGEFQVRRSRKKKNIHKHRHRNNLRTDPIEGGAVPEGPEGKTVIIHNCTNDESSSSSSDESEIEKNPGNPFTITRSKYKQNWMWNFDMDGDHMNINPYGPEFDALGPSGGDLFYGRKWWYFNQDDYVPLG